MHSSGCEAADEDKWSWASLVSVGNILSSSFLRQYARTSQVGVDDKERAISRAVWKVPNPKIYPKT